MMDRENRSGRPTDAEFEALRAQLRKRGWVGGVALFLMASIGMATIFLENPAITRISAAEAALRVASAEVESLQNDVHTRATARPNEEVRSGADRAPSAKSTDVENAERAAVDAALAKATAAKESAQRELDRVLQDRARSEMLWWPNVLRIVLLVVAIPAIVSVILLQRRVARWPRRPRARID